MRTLQLSRTAGRKPRRLPLLRACGLALLLAGVPGLAQEPASPAPTAAATAAQATGAAGTWQGAIELPQAKLGITVDLAQKPDGSWTGAIDIPLQKAENLPLEPVTVDGNSVKFAIKGLPGDPTFEGRLENDEIKGTFTQAPPIPFELNQNGPGTMGAGSAGGHWEGAINLPQGPLQVSVNLAEANGAWTGTIDIPAQQAQGLALEPVAVNGSEATFTIKGVPGNPTFHGAIAGSKMTGDFKQGAPTPFQLARGTAAADQASSQ